MTDTHDPASDPEIVVGDELDAGLEQETLTSLGDDFDADTADFGEPDPEVGH